MYLTGMIRKTKEGRVSMSAKKENAAKSAKELYLEADEQEVYSMTSGSAGLNVSPKKEYCSISNKRLYHKGVSLDLGGGMRDTREDVIELDKISGTAIGTRGNVGLLIVGILTAIVLVGIVLIAMYFVTRVRYIKVNYGGGCTIMEYRWCKMDQIRELQKQIHLAADNARKQNA